MSKNAKNRNYNLILYPEDETHKDALEYIKKNYNHAYILHDKDTDENGEIKKEHYHVVISFTNARSQNNVAKELGITSNYLEKTSSVISSLLYLIHHDDTDKYQYQLDDVRGSMKSNLVKALNSNGKDEDNLMLEVLDYIDKQGYITIKAFMYWACSNGYYACCRRSSYFINSVIKEHNEHMKVCKYEA